MTVSHQASQSAGPSASNKPPSSDGESNRQHIRQKTVVVLIPSQQQLALSDGHCDYTTAHWLTGWLAGCVAGCSWG